MKMLKPCNFIFKNVYYLIISFTVFTCSSYGMEVKPEADKKIRNDAQVLQGEIKEEKKERKYIYDPLGKTDPFKPFIVTQEEKAAKEREKPRTYLETLELSQLSLSVTIIGEKGKWAMVKDAKDDGHVIKEGTLIGTNGGVVYKILPGEVVIREEFTNFRGEKEYRDVSKKTISD
jgi:Tfp pilus assembly protein PilP